MMNKTLLTLFMLLVLASWSTALALDPADYTGVVSIDSVEAQPNESFGVPIRLANSNIDISAVTIPLKFPSPYLTLDSVSLEGSLWSSDFTAYAAIDNVEKTARITVLPVDYTYPLASVATSEGVLAEMFFTLSSEAQSGNIRLDSVYADYLVSDSVHVYTRVDIADNTGIGVFLPEFEAGVVVVRVPTGIDDDIEASLPTEFELAQNYPNPFNPTTTIEFSLPTASRVTVSVYNILGQEVATPADGRFDAGVHRIEFDGAELPSGIYFYRMTWENAAVTKKMILLK
ncbi:MAG: T9SS type A sorting domain-containing protein [candidate division Zixibacteria bacterium]|nr:T9SS type A sorting domain-containing protein [candidate division Zixibacteria bacterium]